MTESRIFENNPQSQGANNSFNKDPVNVKAPHELAQKFDYSPNRHGMTET